MYLKSNFLVERQNGTTPPELGEFLKNFNIHLLCDAEMSPLDSYIREMKTYFHTKPVH